MRRATGTQSTRAGTASPRSSGPCSVREAYHAIPGNLESGIIHGIAGIIRGDPAYASRPPTARRRSRRVRPTEPNDRTSHGVAVFSFSSCVRYLLCYLLSSRPSAVRNVCDCVSVPPSPKGMSLFRNSATTSTNAPSAYSGRPRRRRIGSSISLPPRPSRERERFITEQATLPIGGTP